jgi:hypothetical protein
MLAVLRALRRGWDAIAQGALPWVRDRLLSRAAAVVRDPSWPRTLERGEERLRAWAFACALFVALILALGAAAAFT